MSNPNEEIAGIIKLLPIRPSKTFPDRFRDCETRISSYYNKDSGFLLSLIVAAINAQVHQHNLIEDSVSFLDLEDLTRLAFILGSYAKRGQDVRDLMMQVALQAPELTPESFLKSDNDFSDWWTHADPMRPPSCHHLTFSKGSPFSSTFAAHNLHPTWRLATVGDPLRIGGGGSAECPRCNQNLIHLITLSEPRLRLETCSNSYGPAFYKHDDAGWPTPIEPAHPQGFDGEIVPLMETAVRLAPTPDRWLHQSRGGSNGRQNLFRLGGLPSWVQGPEFPRVPGCDREMQFLLQFDSSLQDERGDELWWGNGGMLYIFWDEQSRISCHLPQFT